VLRPRRVSSKLRHDKPSCKPCYALTLLASSCCALSYSDLPSQAAILAVPLQYNLCSAPLLNDVLRLSSPRCKPRLARCALPLYSPTGQDKIRPASQYLVSTSQAASQSSPYWTRPFPASLRRASPCRTGLQADPYPVTICNSLHRSSMTRRSKSSCKPRLATPRKLVPLLVKPIQTKLQDGLYHSAASSTRSHLNVISQSKLQARTGLIRTRLTKISPIRSSQAASYDWPPQDIQRRSALYQDPPSQAARLLVKLYVKPSCRPNPARSGFISPDKATSIQSKPSCRPSQVSPQRAILSHSASRQDKPSCMPCLASQVSATTVSAALCQNFYRAETSQAASHAQLCCVVPDFDSPINAMTEQAKLHDQAARQARLYCDRTYFSSPCLAALQAKSRLNATGLDILRFATSGQTALPAEQDPSPDMIQLQAMTGQDKRRHAKPGRTLPGCALPYQAKLQAVVMKNPSRK